MMVRHRRLLVAVAAFLLCVAWLRPVWRHGGHALLRPSPSSSSPARFVPPASHPERDAFISAAMAVEFPSPFDPAMLRGLCSQRHHRHQAPPHSRGVSEPAGRDSPPATAVLECDHVHGGIGNVRNHILHCLRFALAAATSASSASPSGDDGPPSVYLLLPRITARNPTDLRDIYGEGARHSWWAWLRGASSSSQKAPRVVPREPLGYLLDAAHFMRGIKEALPCIEILLGEEEEEDDGDMVGKGTTPPRRVEIAVQGWESRRELVLESPAETYEPRHPLEGLVKPEGWGDWFWQWLRNETAQVEGADGKNKRELQRLAGTEEQPSMPEVAHVKLGRAYLEWPVRSDDDGVVDASHSASTEFGKLLSFRADARYLAAAVLWELDQRFGPWEVDPTRMVGFDAPEETVAGGSPRGAEVNFLLGKDKESGRAEGESSTTRRDVASQSRTKVKGYHGAHLRLELDAVSAWPSQDWPYQRFDVQVAGQATQLQQSGLEVVYAACGNRTAAAMFAEALLKEMAKDNPGEEQQHLTEREVPSAGELEAKATEVRQNITVVTKHDLLSESDKALLDSLTFDQQALVDFLVMLKARHFVGVGHSSFAWNIALRRHGTSRDRYVSINETRASGSDTAPSRLHDEYSVIMGAEKHYPVVSEYDDCMWP